MGKISFDTDTIEDLIEMDIGHYRNAHQDLRYHSDAALREHYALHGYSEGRLSHPLALRENFVTYLRGHKTLEIGPFVNPALTHERVKYLDVLSTDELRERAEEIGLSVRNLRNIDFVAKDGGLGLVDEKFELIFSSHNLEHQPDLIHHLNEVSSKLTESGRFAMLVPSAKHCFDADLPLTKISEIFNAHQERRRLHTIGSVIEHRALTTHNDSGVHWKAASQSAVYKRLEPNRIQAAVTEYHASAGAYIDVHSWQFEPHTLADILRTLIHLEFIKFSSVKCWGPVYGRNEFAVELLR